MALPELRAFPALTLPELEALAGRLAGLLAPGNAITLRGDLGAGKTSFARALVRAVSPKETEVTSPTFTLMQSYDVALKSGAQVLWHLDLYRLEEEGEADALGLEELWPQVTVIEWPEIIEKRLPDERLDITFGFTGNEDTRSVTLYGNDAWRQRLAALT